MSNITDNEKRFPVLRLVMRMYKIAAMIVGGIYALIVVFAILDNGIFAGLMLAVVGFFVFVAIYASGEIIEVFLSVEENQRTLVEIQKRALQIQMRSLKQ